MKKSVFLIGPLLFLLVGCVSYWNGTLTSNLSLSPAEYNLIGQANGEAKTFVLFGLIGGNEHSNLVNEAKGDLIRSHPLDSNMYYADWSVSFQKSIHLLGIEQICRVNAGIFSLTKTSKRYERPNSIAVNLAQMLRPDTGILTNGDRVEFFLEGERRQGNLIKFEGNVATIKYYDEKYGYVKITTRLVSEVKKLQ